jgi:hypothetical protein
VLIWYGAQFGMALNLVWRSIWYGAQFGMALNLVWRRCRGAAPIRDADASSEPGRPRDQQQSCDDDDGPNGTRDAILRTIESNRFVTGVTWIDGELWHATLEADESELRRVDPRTGEVLERLEMPPGMGVSGLESDGGSQFFCGGASSGKVRAVRRPNRGTATSSGS